MTETDFPSGLHESYAYDASGNLLSKTDRDGHTITYAYDGLNRLLTKSYPDSTAVNYSYDAGSRLTQVADASGTYGFTYDNLGRTVGMATAYSFLAGQTFTNVYAYDAGGRKTGYTYPDGKQLTYAYDTLNELTSETDANAGTLGFSYDALGRRTQLTRPNNVNSTYAYDAVSELLSVVHKKSSTIWDQAGYTYDPDGNRVGRTGMGNLVYTYDNANQLLEAASTTGYMIEQYAYDAVGNSTTRATSGGNFYPELFNSSNELTEQDLSWGPSLTYTYDANGNRMSVAGMSNFTYTWDFENRLTQATPSSGTAAAYKYDPFGRRIQKTGSAGTTIYLYDGANISEELGATGLEMTRYVFGPSVDEPLALVRGGVPDFYEADGLGSITSLTDMTTSHTVQTYNQLAFGQSPSASTSLSQPFRFTGREYDSDTGLYYYRARYYDPGVGRFLSEDPIGLEGGINAYAYVGNSPTNFSDPAGLLPVINPLDLWTWSPEAEAAFQTYVAAIEAGGVAVGSGFLRGVGGVAAIVFTPTSTAGPDTDELFPPKSSTKKQLDNSARRECKKIDNDDHCEEMYKEDTALCNLHGSRACHQQAAERYAACLAGKPIPPFPWRMLFRVK